LNQLIRFMVDRCGRLIQQNDAAISD